MLVLELSPLVDVCGKREVRNCNTIESSLRSFVLPPIAYYLLATAVSEHSTGRSLSCSSEFRFSVSVLVVKSKVDRNTIRLFKR